MTDKHDKLVEMARECGAQPTKAEHVAGTLRTEVTRLEFTAPQLAAFASAHIASLCGDVEQDGFHLVSVNAGFTELLEALDRADRKGYMPDAIYSAYEGFECRDPASTVAALKARVAELEKNAARYQKLLNLWNGRDMRELFGIEDFAALDAAPQPQQEQP